MFLLIVAVVYAAVGVGVAEAWWVEYREVRWVEVVAVGALWPVALVFLVGEVVADALFRKRGPRV